MISSFHADAAEITPAFSYFPHTITTGQFLFLQCNYSGVPEPTIQWFQNNIEIMKFNGNGTLIVTGLGSTLLVIDEFECAGNGEEVFTCRANNSLGSDETSFTVGMCVMLYS